MLAKQIESYPLEDGQPGGFRARLQYVCDKATTFTLRHVTGGWESAARQMAFTAGLNPRLRMPCCHVVVSWSETESRTDEQMITAIEMMLDELGAGDLQAVIGIHRDRPSPHGHAVFNRVHPVTGKALSMSHSYARLELACRKVEHVMGWPADRGRFDVQMEGDEITLCPKPPAHWERKKAERALGLRPENRAAREHSRRIGSGHLRAMIGHGKISQLRAILDAARNWSGVHEALGQIGFMYQRYRTGARIVEASTLRHMPASGLGARYGLRQMCGRLGRFVPGQMAKAQRALRELKRRQARQRRSIRTKLAGSRSPAARAFREILREDHAEQIKALEAELHLPRAQPSPEEAESIPQRHAHVIRQRQSSLPQVDDHTARRQGWILSIPEAVNNWPEDVQEIVDRFPGAVRADHAGDLLFAARSMDGSITSFDRLPFGASLEVSPAPSALGICAIGPHPADTCLLACTARDALLAMVQIAGPMPMVIVVGDTLSPDRQAYLEWLTQERKIAVDTQSFSNAPDTLRQLSQLFPKASVWETVLPGSANDIDKPPIDESEDQSWPDDISM